MYTERQTARVQALNKKFLFASDNPTYPTFYWSFIEKKMEEI